MRRAAALAALVVLASPVAAASAALPQQLGTVDLATQFDDRIDGALPGDAAASTIAAAGDVNGDGLADMLVGVPGSSNNSREGSGAAYVVFGRTPSAVPIDLSRLGNGGFRIDGANPGDGAGSSLAAAGDVNGDGLADVIVGAPNVRRFGAVNAEGTLVSVRGVGAAYIVWGKRDATRVDLGVLGERGHVLLGGTEPGLYTEELNAFAGAAVAGVGDINGDGLADVVVGAPGRRPGSPIRLPGRAYVVYGSRTPGVVDLGALGERGLVISQGEVGDGFATTVAGVGDLGGDGRAEVVLGAPTASLRGREAAGSVWVVAGREGGGSISVSGAPDNAGGAVARIDGGAAGDQLGSAVAGVGDFSGDGSPDVALGAFGVDIDGRPAAGQVVVLTCIGAVVDLADTSAPCIRRIEGAAAGDLAGWALAGAGDVNGDGVGDLVVGSYGARPGGRTEAGSASVVYGGAGWVRTDLATLGSGGYRIDGPAGGRVGAAVSSLGDVNGDRRPELAVGAPGASGSLGTRVGSGSAFVLFGFGAGSVDYGPGSRDDGVTKRAVVELVPRIARTGPVAFAVSPQLPAGLSLDASSGVIRGIPSAPAARADYTVRMTDLAGVWSTVVSFAVADSLAAQLRAEVYVFRLRGLLRTRLLRVGVFANETARATVTILARRAVPRGRGPWFRIAGGRVRIGLSGEAYLKTRLVRGAWRKLEERRVRRVSSTPLRIELASIDAAGNRNRQIVFATLR